MELEVLGANATAPNQVGPASGYIVWTDQGAILVDAGPGTMAAYTARHDLDDVRAIVVTHAHADHCLDLMAWAYRWTYPTVRPQVPLYFPEGAESMIRGFDALFGISSLPTMHSPIQQSFTATALPLDGAQAFEVAGCSMISYAAQHAVPSAALRFSDGERVIAFSSDTGDCAGIRAAARAADLFVCEATWLDEPDAASIGHGHLTAAQAGTISAEADARMLVLTHLADPGQADEASRRASDRFPRELVLARPGLRL